jgi:hypothetical protein
MNTVVLSSFSLTMGLYLTIVDSKPVDWQCKTPSDVKMSSIVVSVIAVAVAMVWGNGSPLILTIAAIPTVEGIPIPQTIDAIVTTIRSSIETVKVRRAILKL